MSMLPAIILESKKQKEKVARLVRYWRDLDGTEVRVVPLPPHIDEIPHPVGVEYAIRWIGQQMNEPWLYVEADSIPLCRGAVDIITREYKEANETYVKPFMLPSLKGLSPHDVASAIGVWPARLDLCLPKEIPTEWPYFDYFVYQTMDTQIHFTKTIQHSYGVYLPGSNRLERRHVFPKDKGIIRPEAAIFHADPTQSIIRGGLAQSFFHSGDFGDIVAALATIKKQGGGRIVIGAHHDTVILKCPREVMNLGKFEFIRPLLESQPYVRSVEYSPNWEDCDHDFSQFRLSPMKPHENLATWQARSLGRADDNFDLGPWLEVAHVKHERVIVSRSLRYWNKAFPWELVAKKYGNRLLFIGTEYEHRTFEHVVGTRVERARISDAFEMAQLIAGAPLQFSNQSLPWWIAAGLGKRVYQETYQQEPNSRIERDELFYTQSNDEFDRLNKMLLTRSKPLDTVSA